MRKLERYYYDPTNNTYYRIQSKLVEEYIFKHSQVETSPYELIDRLALQIEELQEKLNAI